MYSGGVVSIRRRISILAVVLLLLVFAFISQSFIETISGTDQTIGYLYSSSDVKYYGNRYVLDGFDRPGGGYYLRKTDGIYAYDKNKNLLWHWKWTSGAWYISANIYDTSRVWVVWASGDKIYVGIVKDGALLSYEKFTVSPFAHDVQVLYFRTGFINAVNAYVTLLFSPESGAKNSGIWNGKVASVYYDGNNVKILWTKSRDNFVYYSYAYSPFAIAKEGGLYIGDKPYFYMLGVCCGSWVEDDYSWGDAYLYTGQLFKVNYITGEYERVAGRKLVYPDNSFAKEPGIQFNVYIYRARLSSVVPVKDNNYLYYRNEITTSIYIEHENGTKVWSVSKGTYGWDAFSMRPFVQKESSQPIDLVYHNYYGEGYNYKSIVLSSLGVGMIDSYYSTPVFFEADREEYMPPWYGSVRVMENKLDTDGYIKYQVFPGTQYYPYDLKVYPKVKPLSVKLHYPKDSSGCYYIYISRKKNITGTMTISAMQYATVTISSDGGKDSVYISRADGTGVYKINPDLIRGNVSVSAEISRKPYRFSMPYSSISLPGGGDIGCIRYNDITANIRFIFRMKGPEKAVSTIKAPVNIGYYHMRTTATIDLYVYGPDGKQVSKVIGVKIPKGTGTITEIVNLAPPEGQYKVKGLVHLPGYPDVEEIQPIYVYRVVMFDPQLSVAQPEVETYRVSVDVYAHDGTTTFYDVSSGTPKVLRSINLSGKTDHKYVVNVPLATIGEYKITAKTEQYGVESNFSNIVKVVRLPKSPKILYIKDSRDKDGNIEVMVVVYEKGLLKLTIGDATLFEGVKDKGSYTFTYTLPHYGKYDIKATLSVNGYTSKEVVSQVEYVPPTPTIEAPQTTTAADVALKIDAVAGTLRVYVDGSLQKSINHAGGIAETTVHLSSEGQHIIEAEVEVEGSVSDRAQTQIRYESSSSIPAPIIQVPPTVEGLTAIVRVLMPIDGTLYMALGGHDLGASQLTKGTHEITISISGIGKHTLSAYIEKDGKQSVIVSVDITRIPMPVQAVVPTSTYHRDIDISFNAEDTGTLEIVVDGVKKAYSVNAGPSTINLHLDRGMHTIQIRLCVSGYCGRWSVYTMEIFDKVELWIGKRNYMVNGNAGAMDVAPFIDPTVNRTMVPLRFILEGLGFEVKWHGDTRMIEIIGTVYREDGSSYTQKVYMHMPKAKAEKHGAYVVYPGSSIVKVEKEGSGVITVDMKNYNGQDMGIPFIYQSRTFVPVRFISEIFGAKVGWDGAERKVTIER